MKEEAEIIYSKRMNPFFCNQGEEALKGWRIWEEGSIMTSPLVITFIHSSIMLHL